MLESLALADRMKWVVGYEMRRLAAYPFIRILFACHGLKWGKRWRIWGMPMIQRFSGSSILLGDGLQLRSWPSTNPLTPNHRVVLATRSSEAVIRLGEDAGLTGATLVAAERIEIGDRVVVGANALIVDTDFHPLDPLERRSGRFPGKSLPVIIEDDVFIGTSAMILKGVHIQAEAVVGAGSVVTGDVPRRAIVAGNPARVVGEI
jgi:acetyltransferase-like isoleucine patch superfamily enzyme